MHGPGQQSAPGILLRIARPHHQHWRSPHLGFEAEFGTYGGNNVEIPFDGKWNTPSGDEILVEVKTFSWPLTSVSQLGEYMEAYAQATGKPPQQLFGLYVVGDGDFEGLADQIKGGEYRNRIKLISFQDLLRLFRLRRVLEEQVPPSRVAAVLQDLLLPFDSVNVGSILDVIEAVALVTLGEDDIGGEPAPAVHPGPEWRRSDLYHFLDECQPYQVALLLALCAGSNGSVSASELVRRMKALAPSVPGLPPNQKFSTRTIGGARSGISKREQQLGKENLIETDGGRYTIRTEYRDWVSQWLEDRGLLPVRMPLEEELEGLFECADSGTG